MTYGEAGERFHRQAFQSNIRAQQFNEMLLKYRVAMTFPGTLVSQMNR